MIANKYYISRFINGYGEEWEFKYDPLKKEGFLQGSDVDWKSYRVVEGRVPELVLNDEEITKVPMYKRARMGIGYLPQEASIFRKLTVEENLLAVLEMNGIGKKERKEKCDSLLEELGITRIRKNIGFQLSGGERRRTEIARALTTDPKFMLLDEPFAGVDPIAVEDIMNIVAKLKERGIGVLITDHNVHETLSIVDNAYILISGKIFKQGSAEELAEDEEIRHLYLGEKFKLDRY